MSKKTIPVIITYDKAFSFCFYCIQWFSHSHSLTSFPRMPLLDMLAGDISLF